jgi:tetratricopeptide (TPR) repeat protein
VEYASCLSLLGHIYFLVGDRENSIICIEKSSSIIKNILGENNIDYIHALTTLSNSYPRTTKAIEIGEKISDLLQIMNQTDTPEYINNLHNLAYNYSALGDTTKSSQIINEILDI